MKLTELWKEGSRPTLSFELYPARNEKAAVRLEEVIDKLVALEPDFVSVTFGAGGSTREGSRQLVEKLVKEKGLTVLAYFAGYGLGPDDTRSVLDDYREIGVESVLVVRGDPPHEQPDFKPHPESFGYASEMLAFVESHCDLCLGCAGYPEGHIEAQSRDRDLEFLKLKVENGAEFVITNYAYDNDLYFEYLERCRAMGLKTPFLPGVMPIYNEKMMESLARLCGATVTSEIREGLAALPAGDKKALSAFGVDYAVAQCRGLLERGAPGVHLYTMDRSKSVVEIVTRLRAEGLL